MDKQNLNYMELEEDIYESSRPFYLKIFLISIFVFILTFISNFPVKKIIENNVAAALSSLKCPVNYEKMEVSLFLPKINLRGTHIGLSCFSPALKDIKLKELPITMSFPSLFPPGLKLNAEVLYKSSRINLYPTLTLTGDTLIKVEDTNISSELLNDLFKSKPIAGNYEVNIVTKIKNNKASNLVGHIKSSNFKINSMSMNEIDLPSFDIGNLSIKLESKNLKKFKLIELIVGGSDSMVNAKFSGEGELNSFNAISSRIKLDGTFKLSAQTLQDFPIIDLLLPQTKNEDGYYVIKKSGTIKDLLPSGFAL